MLTHTAYTYFGISGDFDPYKLATRIQLVPDECTAKHSNNSIHNLPRTSLMRYAQLETYSALIDIYDLAEKSLDILEPHLDSFSAAIREFNAEAVFQVVLYFPISEDIAEPAIGFSKRVISFIASTGASVDIDSYRN
jgi:Domain of unknown function (DUF4279)